MRLCAPIGAEARGEFASPLALVKQAVEAEADGFPAAWAVHFSRNHDALSVLAVAASRTHSIDLGVGIVPAYPRHPFALAQQAATVQAIAGGRFTLGVGVSHRSHIEGMYRLHYTKPAQFMRDYLSVLVPALQGESVTHESEFFAADGGIEVVGTSPVSVVVGALSRRMVQAGGQLADGIVTWLAGPRTLQSDIIPTVMEAASSVERPSPRIIVALPVAVCDDVVAGRRAANVLFDRYHHLPVYQALFKREGVTGVGELCIVGDEAAVEHQLREVASFGATEFWPIPLPLTDDGDRGLKRAHALLRGLAPEIGS